MRYFKIIVYGFCLLWCLSFCDSLSANIVISQILYDSPYNEQITKYPYSDGEFIELYNTGVEEVSLSGWHLQGGGKTEQYEFPYNTVIPAGGYLALAFRYYYSGGDFHLSTYASQYSNITPYQVQEQHVLILSNTGELLSLVNNENQIVDSIRYKKQSSSTNADSIPYMECRSLHRKTIKINAGHIVSNTMEDWEADLVTFGSDVPMERNFISMENYHYSQATSAVLANKNYRIMVQPLDETMSIDIINGNVSVSSDSRAKITYSYYDGLGREEENIIRKYSPQGNDLADFRTYNSSGKCFQQWLVTPIREDGYISPSSMAPLVSSFYQDDMPYTQTIYENSPLGRPINTTIAGNSYSARPNEFNYQTNESLDVIRFSVVSSGLKKESYYQEGTLNKMIKKDSDGKQIVEYTNAQGLLLMRQAGAENKTYYIYDKYGRLCYVIPEVLSSRLSTGITPENDTNIYQYAYVYHYDSKDNLIYKKLPGCEPTSMVYDKAGKLILIQDGNQHERGEDWTYNAYDKLGRIVYSAVIKLSNITHQNLITIFSDIVAYETTSTDNTCDNIGYTNSYFAYAAMKILFVNYYDSYDFLQLSPHNVAQNLQYEELAGYGKRYDNYRGLLTGQRIYDLNDSLYQISSIYYDVYGNIVQRKSTALLSDYHYQFFAYNFDRTIRQTLDDWGNMTEHYQYIYDHAGRLVKSLYQLNNSPILVLNVNEYDETGRLVAKARHKGKDKEHFNYDMRGQLTQIASGDFTEHLYYANNIPDNASPMYNGNISAATVVQGGQAFNYIYQYNQQNWLTNAMLNSGSTTIGSETFEYDPLGNIIHLSRYNNGIIIDDLNMQYEGYQLTSVQENIENTDLFNVKEYITRSNDSGMSYDANGNLIADGDRSISEITYNILNLPDTIRFYNGNVIVYRYDALGKKTKMSYLTRLEPILTSIVEDPETHVNYSLINKTETWYDCNRQKFRGMGIDSLWRWEKEIVYNAEGYTENKLNDTIISSADMCYFRRDHLGNNVAVWNATSSNTIQRNFYYASGLPMPYGMGNSVQKKKYCNKEFEEFNGINEYDSNARHYYASICRTTTVDPLCENFYNLSPYSWCGNNYVNAIDPNGEMWYYYPCDLNSEDLRQEYFWVEDEEFYELKKKNPEIRGASAILVFEGARYEFLGWKNNKYGYIDGEGAITADVTLYGPNGPDDITKGMIGFTMTTDYSTFGAIASDDYLVEWDKNGKRGKLKSHWKLSALDKTGEERWQIPEIDGNLNCSPQAGLNHGKPYKTGIYIHSTNQDGYASVTAWDNETGRPINGISVGCPLLSPQDFKLLNQKMSGFKNFLMRIIR